MDTRERLHHLADRLEALAARIRATADVCTVPELAGITAHLAEFHMDQGANQVQAAADSLQAHHDAAAYPQ